MFEQKPVDHVRQPHELVLKAVELAGSQSRLSRAVGVTRSAVYYWVQHGTRPGPRTIRELRAFIDAPDELRVRMTAKVPTSSESGGAHDEI
ncbi:MAG: hypothetical protein ACYDB0_05555 [Acidithiobacillus sp.]